MGPEFSDHMRDHAVEPQLTVPGGAHHTRDASRDLHADFRPQALSGMPVQADRPRRQRGVAGVAGIAIAVCVVVVGVGAFLAGSGHSTAPASSRNLPLTSSSMSATGTPSVPPALPSSAPLLVAPPAVPASAPAQVVEAPPPPKPVSAESDAFRGMLQPKIAPVAPSSPATPPQRTVKAEPPVKAASAKVAPSVKAEAKSGKADPNWAMQKADDAPRFVAPPPAIKAVPAVSAAAASNGAEPAYGANSVTVGGTTYVAGQEPRALGTLPASGANGQ